jgi:hypothetical protein
VSDIRRQEWDDGVTRQSFGARVLDLIEAGRGVAEVAHDLEIGEKAELTAAKKRVARPGGRAGGQPSSC